MQTVSHGSVRESIKAPCSLNTLGQHGGYLDAIRAGQHLMSALPVAQKLLGSRQDIMLPCSLPAARPQLGSCCRLLHPQGMGPLPGLSHPAPPQTILRSLCRLQALTLSCGRCDIISRQARRWDALPRGSTVSHLTLGMRWHRRDVYSSAVSAYLADRQKHLQQQIFRSLSAAKLSRVPSAAVWLDRG